MINTMTDRAKVQKRVLLEINFCAFSKYVRGSKVDSLPELFDDELAIIFRIGSSQRLGYSSEVINLICLLVRCKDCFISVKKCLSF